MARNREAFGVGDRPGRRGFLGAAIGGCAWCGLSRRSLAQQPAHGQAGGTSPPHWSYEGEAEAATGASSQQTSNLASSACNSHRSIWRIR